MSRLFPESDGEETLRGGVERVTYHDADSGFCVLRVKVAGRREPVAVVGRVASVAEGEDVECRGAWVRDPKHGRQFEAREIRTIPPRTIEGIRKYLSSGMVRGIGPHFAKKLVRAFGERVFDVIENEPERLLELPGIGTGRQTRLLAAWNERRTVRDILVFLQSHGLGTARAVRIYKTYGDEAVERIREDPYRLTFDVRGFGFRTADDFARRIGIEDDSPVRVRAGVRHVLDEAAGAGHCAVPLEELTETSARLLGVESPLARDAVDAEVAGGNAVAEDVDGVS